MNKAAAGVVIGICFAGILATMVALPRGGDSPPLRGQPSPDAIDKQIQRVISREVNNKAEHANPAETPAYVSANPEQDWVNYKNQEGDDAKLMAIVSGAAQPQTPNDVRERLANEMLAFANISNVESIKRIKAALDLAESTGSLGVAEVIVLKYTQLPLGARPIAIARLATANVAGFLEAACRCANQTNPDIAEDVSALREALELIGIVDKAQLSALVQALTPELRKLAEAQGNK